jgi:hypothetical protein
MAEARFPRDIVAKDTQNRAPVVMKTTVSTIIIGTRTNDIPSQVTKTGGTMAFACAGDVKRMAAQEIAAPRIKAVRFFIIASRSRIPLFQRCRAPHPEDASPHNQYQIENVSIRLASSNLQ